VRNSFQNTTNYKKSTNAEKLVLVRTSILYGLSFENVKQEKISYNSGITSIPTIIFFNNNTECFIDYSNQSNKDLELKTKQYFTKIPANTTIFILNGQYYDTIKEERADISGEYIFKDFFNGIVRATVTSVGSLADNYSRYDKKYFEEIPLISSNALTETEGQNITVIRNLFGSTTKNSFNYLGIKVGDFISFSGIKDKYKIIEYSIDPNGIETLKVEGKIEQQNLIDSKILVNVYIPCTDSYTSDPNLNENEFGSCVETVNGVVISCTDNNTISQCRFRSNTSKNIQSTITLNTFCTTPDTDPAIEYTTTDKLVQITNYLASSIASSLNRTSNIAGPINTGSNSKSAFYGRT